LLPFSLFKWGNTAVAMATNPLRRSQQDSLILSDALAVLQSPELLMHIALKNGQVRSTVHGL